MCGSLLLHTFDIESLGCHEFHDVVIELGSLCYHEGS